MTSMPGTLDDRHFDFDEEPVFGADEERGLEGEHVELEHDVEHNIEDMVDEEVHVGLAPSHAAVRRAEGRVPRGRIDPLATHIRLAP